MTRLLPFALFAVSTPALASGSWSGEVAAAMAQADPAGDWQAIPVPQAAKTKADILIERLSDGTTTAIHNGNVTLKRGIVAARSLDGTEALLVAEDVMVCDPMGCETLGAISAADIALLENELRRCVSPLCGGIDVLVAVAPVYLVVDVSIDRDGSDTYTVRDLLIGFDNVFTD